MAWKGFTGGVAYIYPAQFQAVYIRAGSSEKWQTLGAITDGSLNIKDFAAPDSLTRNKAINAYDLTAKCNMMQCHSVELKLTDNICSGANDFLFKLADAVAITGSPVASAGWVEFDHANIGVKAKVVADGAPDKERQIQLEWQGSMLKSDANEILLYTPTLQATDFEATGSGGTFHGIGTYTAATDGGAPTNSHILPCGISSMTLDGAGLSSPDTISPITNVKFTLEMLAAQDALRRFLPVSLDVNVEVDWMASKNSDLLLLGNASQSDVKAIFTFIDTEAFTFDNQTGLETNFENVGNTDKERVVRLTFKGKTLQSTIGSIAS